MPNNALQRATVAPKEKQMNRYTAHVTARDGITRRHSLTAPDLHAAHAAVQTLAAGLYGARFTYGVRPA